MHTYDPARHVFSFAGNLVPTGYGKDTFIEASRAEDGFSTAVGVGGEVARAKNNNKSGMVKLTLLASSQANDILSALAAQDDADGSVTGALFVQDLLGTTVLHAEEAWIKKLPDVKRAKEVGEVEWEFECAALEIFSGGVS